jgi:hypothetical protein
VLDGFEIVRVFLLPEKNDLSQVCSKFLLLIEHLRPSTQLATRPHPGKSGTTGVGEALGDATGVLESTALEVGVMSLGMLLDSGVEEESKLDSDDVVANTTDDVLEVTTEGWTLEDASEDTTVELTELEDTGVEEIKADDVETRAELEDTPEAKQLRSYVT